MDLDATASAKADVPTGSSEVWWVRRRETLNKMLPVGHGLDQRQQNFMAAMLMELLLKADEEAFVRGMKTAYEALGVPLTAQIQVGTTDSETHPAMKLK